MYTMLQQVADGTRGKDGILGAQISAVASIALILIFILAAVILAVRVGKAIVTSIVNPLTEVEKVANELAEGNLHSNLEYHSDDEIGNLAHNLRKSIRILGSYVDGIGKVMDEFSKGNFAVQAEGQWRGDFVGIRDSFADFQKSMAETITGIQDVAEQLKRGSDQVAASSLDR